MSPSREDHFAPWSSRLDYAEPAPLVEPVTSAVCRAVRGDSHRRCLDESRSALDFVANAVRITCLSDRRPRADARGRCVRRQCVHVSSALAPRCRRAAFDREIAVSRIALDRRAHPDAHLPRARANSWNPSTVSSSSVVHVDHAFHRRKLPRARDRVGGIAINCSRP